MRLFPTVFFVLLFALPISAQNNDAAAFPKQELGVRPPVLKGFAPLTDDELREGWIRLFDGVSLYGWQTLEGKFTVQNGLLVNDPDKAGVIKCTSRFGNSTLVGQRRQADGSGDWTSFQLGMTTSNSDRAGTIQFQGHDPETDILFQNIRIGEL